MKPTNEKLAADILSAGKKEFLEKGFQKASMRSIASSLAVTTGAIYRYYTDKEAIFEALVEEPAKELADRYRASQQKFAEMSLKEQLEGLPDVADHEYVWMVDYVYDHFDAFKLIACCSTGTRYEHYLDALIEIEDVTDLSGRCVYHDYYHADCNHDFSGSFPERTRYSEKGDWDISWVHRCPDLDSEQPRGRYGRWQRMG